MISSSTTRILPRSLLGLRYKPSMPLSRNRFSFLRNVEYDIFLLFPLGNTCSVSDNLRRYLPSSPDSTCPKIKSCSRLHQNNAHFSLLFSIFYLHKKIYEGILNLFFRHHVSKSVKNIHIFSNASKSGTTQQIFCKNSKHIFRSGLLYFHFTTG